MIEKEKGEWNTIIRENKTFSESDIKDPWIQLHENRVFMDGQEHNINTKDKHTHENLHHIIKSIFLNIWKSTTNRRMVKDVDSSQKMKYNSSHS